MRRLILVVLGLWVGCSGPVDGTGPGGTLPPGDTTPGETGPSGPGVGKSGPRRLTQREYANTIQALLGNVLTESDVQERDLDGLREFAGAGVVVHRGTTAGKVEATTAT